jgi:hypothetical protein
MLSDVISDVLEQLWDGVETYAYSEKYRASLIAGIAQLDAVRIMLDHATPPNFCPLTRAKQVAEARWATRACGKDYWDYSDDRTPPLDAQLGACQGHSETDE